MQICIQLLQRNIQDLCISISVDKHDFSMDYASFLVDTSVDDVDKNMNIHKIMLSSIRFYAKCE